MNNKRGKNADPAIREGVQREIETALKIIFNHAIDENQYMENLVLFNPLFIKNNNISHIFHK